MIRDEQAQTLVKLGLTFVQAKTYLNLAKLGKADIKTIATATNVARQDVYRIMSTLQERGLAEKIIAKTAMYKATPIKEGLSVLLEKQKTKFQETEKQVNDLFDNFYEKIDQKSPREDIQFSITSDLVLLLKTHEKLAETAENSIEMLIPLKLNEEQFIKKFGYVKEAVKRGVKIRVILQEGGSKNVGNLKPQNSPFELRHLPESDVSCGMHIFDGRELTLAVSKKKATPSLWTNSPHVVELAEVYFENMWNNKLSKTELSNPAVD